MSTNQPPRPGLVSEIQLADAIQRTDRQVRNLRKDGVFVAEYDADRRVWYDLEKSVAAFEEHRQRAAKAQEEGHQPFDLKTMRARKLELELEILMDQRKRDQGETLTVPEFRATLEGTLSVVRSRLLEAASSQAGKVIGIDTMDQARQVLTDIMRSCLADASEAAAKQLAA